MSKKRVKFDVVEDMDVDVDLDLNLYRVYLKDRIGRGLGVGSTLYLRIDWDAFDIYKELISKGIYCSVPINGEISFGYTRQF